MNEDALLRQCGLLPELSWLLIAYKLMYYRPDLVHKSWHKELTISDTEYDRLEVEYNAEFKGGDGPYTTNMVGIDLTRPSVRLAVEKYSERRVKALSEEERVESDLLQAERDLPW